MSDTEYFASKEDKKLASILLAKSTAWYNTLESNLYLEKLRRSWAAYHGAYYSDTGNSHQVTFSGEQEELVNLPVNHYRNIAQHMLNMTTATRPAMESRAINTDYKSLVQAHLANGLLDYYMREKKLERYLKTAVEYAVVFGSGYIKMEWNATSGEAYDYSEELKTTVYEGDAEFTNLSPLDIVVDSTKENNNHDWILCRSYKNRFDLIAKYPELEEEIKRVDSKSDYQKFKFNILNYSDETDDVPIFEFYHKRSESMPDGRYMMFLSDSCVLVDVPMPYRNLPVFRMSPSDILGTPYGYSPMFDILPIQEAVNTLYSTVLTNQNAFGVQNILVPRGADIAISNLAGGLNIIECNIQAGKPEALNLTQTPQEIFKFIEQLERTAETISGINSVVRGNPEASLRSGTALALVQSTAIQFMSGLQSSYIQLIEDTGSSLINMLKDFASTPRVASIVGKGNRAYLKEFTGGDLSNISRVHCDVANPLARTISGRVEMAEQLLQYQLLKTPQEFFAIIDTGQLDLIAEDHLTEIYAIKQENEDLMMGKVVIALPTDAHKEHIVEHKTVLSDPELRRDPVLSQAVIDHIKEHLQLLTDTDPNLLAMFGQQSLAPPPAPGMPPGAPQGATQGGGGEVAPSLAMPEGGPAEVAGPGIENGVQLPKVPEPPQVG